ncbi:hypothetical protein [Asticcacaulis sp.]|uniref:hypothetical protein n=1 Tax=Asticcacaulis sp. TaxID=1872648 RepID=UPI00261125E8|nr:hypothetical protein [Asticcacaulis sp.]
MLGLFLPARYRLPVLAALLVLLIAGVVYGLNSGAFEQNNREALRLAREAAAAR